MPKTINYTGYNIIDLKKEKRICEFNSITTQININNAYNDIITVQAMHRNILQEYPVKYTQLQRNIILLENKKYEINCKLESIKEQIRIL